jgi:leucyl-tRNA synthetase
MNIKLQYDSKMTDASSKSIITYDDIIMMETGLFDENNEIDFDDGEKGELITVPYPYQNGRLHLGHGITTLRTDIHARYLRGIGKKVLFPFGFHGTGMPIVACAQKLKEELIDKTKMEKENSQTKILLSMGVSEDELINFVNPKYWLIYFPQIAKKDIIDFGLSVDHRRSFVTTDINPHYDSFIKWQFEHLNKQGRLYYGKKKIIYSIKDGQPCADHDRSIGEGVEPKKYYLIKFKLTDDNNIYDGNTFVLIATLHPETIYASMNLWIKPDGDYVVFKMNDCNYITRFESWRNLCCQYECEYEIINKIKGHELHMKKTINPLNLNVNLIYGLKEVSDEMGTGIVMSVPAHASFDAYYYKKYISIEKPLSAISIDDDEYYAWNLITEKFNITNIQTTSEEAYKKMYHCGILNVGDYKGTTIIDMLKIIENPESKFNLELKMIEYYEPEKKVISRSGDICVVSNTDQWFIKYDDSTVKEKVRKHIEYYMDLKDGIRKKLLQVLDWIKEWPVSRTVGMGTYLLDSDKFLIDSLSDSTIYMAYYTIAHLVSKYDVSKYTFDIWNYIFLKKSSKPKIEDKKFNDDIDRMKKEFNFWYPITRVSGKDLVGNHLIMCLMNHAFIWNDEPEKWPHCYSINGHLMIDGEKMSKSTGNFYTLNEIITKYGVSATRFSLTESANESVNDANFQTSSASKMKEKFLSDYHDFDKVKTYYDLSIDRELSFIDKVFIAKIEKIRVNAIKSYESFNFRDVLNYSYKNLMSEFKSYVSKTENNVYSEYYIDYVHDSKYYYLNKKCISRYISLWISLNYPIIPQYVNLIKQTYFPEFSITIDTSSIVLEEDSLTIVIANMFEYASWKNNSSYEKSDKLTFNPKIIFSLSFTDIEYKIAEMISYAETNDDLKIIKKKIMDNMSEYGIEKKDIASLASFIQYTFKLKDTCGSDWFKYIHNTTIIKNMIELYYKFYTNKLYTTTIEIIDSGDKFKHNIVMPLIT